uniref:Uncharacterized protein n=1 Tax=Anguilla anguilla TaxID=7936 RepID=A0A0E9QXL2_ANGAN
MLLHLQFQFFSRRNHNKGLLEFCYIC